MRSGCRVPPEISSGREVGGDLEDPHLGAKALAASTGLRLPMNLDLPIPGRVR